MEILAHATNTIAEGEVLQLLNCHNADTTEVQYMEVIQSKTAKLFEAASQIGAVLGGQSASVERALAAYGMHLGTAFQLIDDVLDFSASPEEIGKNVGDDLAEGKPTLPLIHAMHQGESHEAQLIRGAIEIGGLEHIDEVLAAIESTGAIAYTDKVARKEAANAITQLQVLPDSEHKGALMALCEFSVERKY